MWDGVKRNVYMCVCNRRGMHVRIYTCKERSHVCVCGGVGGWGGEPEDCVGVRDCVWMYAYSWLDMARRCHYDIIVYLIGYEW